ncbi:hypothetical protein AVEN_72243-1 [Araneus ventricosus]|uniref:Uncharacterized protein n=1 Tax=Araneus ventricosus TaxID=182803 RepID=A0A4Y2GW72_ARAVE|nr:hypothetical protein AVEN_72243-1 [Araneus ventricosus]
MNAAISVRSLLEILQPKIFGDFFSSKGKGQGKQTGEDAVTPVRLRISAQLPPTCQQQVLYSCGIIFLTHLLKKVSLNSSSAVAIRPFFRERDQLQFAHWDGYWRWLPRKKRNESRILQELQEIPLLFFNYVNYVS